MWEYLFYRSSSTQAMVIWLASILADVLVLAYHIAEVPHPKFSLRVSRTVCINMHAFSGAAECITGVFLFGYQRGAQGRAVIMVIMLLFSLVHLITAMLQARDRCPRYIHAPSRTHTCAL